MQVFISISSPKQPEERLLVAIDETRCFLQPSETCRDMLLGEIARIHPFCDTARGPIARIEELCREGVSCPRAVMMPAAGQVVVAPDGFDVSALNHIHIDLIERRIDLGLESYSLDDFCGAPADRWRGAHARPSRQGTHPFAYRYHNASEDVHRNDLEAASLIAGMFDQVCPGDYRALDAGFVMLCGLLLGLRGDVFTQCVSGPLKSGVSSMKGMLYNFLAEGYVVSDRAWMPRRVLKGYTFEDCLAACDPALFDLGRRLGAFAGLHTPQLCRQALLSLLLRLEEDSSQYFLRDEYHPEPSNHDRLAIEDIISNIATTIDLDPSRLERARPR